MPGRVEKAVYDVAGMSLSALVARPDDGVPPRGTLLALHGGGSRAAYWHRDDAPTASLPLLGAALGWTVLAVDRPGYGASAGLDRARQALDGQKEALYALLDTCAPPGPVFLVGHSMGGILALRMAADDRAGALLGAAVAAIPLGYTRSRSAALDAVPTDGDVVPPLRGGAPGSFFGPPGTYDAALLTREGRVVAPVPMAEFIDARENPRTLPDVLRRVRMPVQWTVAEHETSDYAGAAVLGDVRELLSAAPRVEVHVQPGAGHNISLHHTARAYHLRVLAFAEECSTARALNGSAV